MDLVHDKNDFHEKILWGPHRRRVKSAWTRNGGKATRN